jgi:Ras-related protein Rab-1A
MGLNDFDFLVKLLLIGDSGVGKTNILMQYVDGVSCENYIATIGVDFKIKTIMVGNKKVKLQIWDTAGQERFKTITSSYYRGAQGIIIVYDQTNKETFDHVKKWLRDVDTYAGENVAKILIGNKSDLGSKKVISTQEGKELADEYKMKFFETSAKNGTNISEAFDAVATESIINAVGDTKPRAHVVTLMMQEHLRKPSTTCCKT